MAIDATTEKMRKAFIWGVEQGQDYSPDNLENGWNKFLSALEAEMQPKPQSISDALLLETHLRREALCRIMPCCPKCHEVHQIQLVEWLGSDAKWKCRMCKHAWTFEPILEAETPAPVQPDSPIELAVREVAHLVLKPNQPYIFRVMKDCKACMNAANPSQQTAPVQPGELAKKIAEAARELVPNGFRPEMDKLVALIQPLLPIAPHLAATTQGEPPAQCNHQWKEVMLTGKKCSVCGSVHIQFDHVG